MSNLEYIAYEREHFTIEWYFDSKNKTQALESFYDMSDSQKRKLLMLFKIIGALVKYLIKPSLEMKMTVFMHSNLSRIDSYPFLQLIRK